MSAESSSTSLPMAPLSAPWLQKHLIGCSNPSDDTASAIPSSVSTSVEITIVTTEEVPNRSNDAMSSTTTVERSIRLCLTLPPFYATKNIKSVNVRLHQDAVPAPTTTSPTASDCFVEPCRFENSCLPGSVPSSSAAAISPGLHQEYYNNNTTEAQQQWQQKQLHLLGDERNPQVLPATVASSQDCGITAFSAVTDSSAPHPETVSSFPNSIPVARRNHDHPNSNKRRRSTRTTNDNEAVPKNRTTATQLPRKKRKESIPPSTCTQ